MSALYREMAEHLPHAMLVHHGGGEIVFANASAIRLAGLPRGETLIGRPIAALFAPPYLKDARDSLLGYAAHNSNVLPRRERMTRVDGSHLEVELATTAFVSAGAGHVQLVFDDATPRLRAERREEARRLAGLSRLAGGVAHQMNNVLATVLARAAVLRDEPANAELRPDLSAIITSALRGGEIAARLLGFARGGMYRRERVSLSALAKCSAERAHRYARIGVVVESELGAEDDAPSDVIGDQAQLASAIDAVIDNALESLGAYGSIKIRVRHVDLGPGELEAEESQQGRFVCVSCQDDGAGMTHEECRRAVEPYVSSRGLGRGLGLAMVYGVLGHHGGFLRLRSEVGRGTCAELWLPLAPPVVPSFIASPPKTLPPRVLEPQGVVLVIDDEPLVRATARRVLTHLGYTVVEAGDGVTGLQLFTAQPDAFKCVLLDLLMPGVSGDVVLRRMLTLRPAQPVILCTGYTMDHEVEALLGLGHVRFLQKPYGIAQLDAQLASLTPALS